MARTEGDLAQLLNVLVFQYRGTRASFAHAARISRAQLSHFMNPGPKAQRPGLLACLKIAAAGHCSPARVLQAAGLHDAAGLLDDLYGDSGGLDRHTRRRETIRPTEIELLQRWRLLDVEMQSALMTLIRASAERTAATKSAAIDPSSRVPATTSAGGSR